MLQFILARDTGKTKAWSVFCSGNSLGEVKWYAPWRRYCFFPGPSVLFDSSCLKEIIRFVDAQMAMRKAA